MLTDAGGVTLLQTDLTKPIQQFFSNDYGRTWPESKTFQPPGLEGSFGGVEGYFGGEGNALVNAGQTNGSEVSESRVYLQERNQLSGRPGNGDDPLVYR